jgi:hypothetical protein
VKRRREGTGTTGLRLPTSKKRKGMRKRSHVPVFLPVSGQEHWIRGYGRRTLWYRCDRTLVRF